MCPSTPSHASEQVRAGDGLPLNHCTIRIRGGIAVFQPGERDRHGTDLVGAAVRASTAMAPRVPGCRASRHWQCGCSGILSMKDEPFDRADAAEPRIGWHIGAGAVALRPPNCLACGL